MPQSLSKVYLHITFSTKHRANLIDKSVENKLFEYLGGICRNLECNPIQIGGFQNHIHILCTLSRKIAIMKLVEEIKKSSSKWIKTVDEKYKDFYWQDGYGVFSVNPAEIDVVIAYIQNQEVHHTKRSFQDEYRLFLKKYNVEYDEKYVWD